MSGKKIERWIDTSSFPRYDSGRYKNKINWVKCIGLLAPFVYGDVHGNAVVTENVDNDYVAIELRYDNNTSSGKIGKRHFLDAQFGRFIRKGIDKDTELYNLLVNKDEAKNLYPNTNNKVLLKCPICGHEDYYSLNNVSNKGFSCSACSDGISYPEKFMRNILVQLKVDFKNQVTKSTPGFEWIPKNYRYDFYVCLKDKKFLIEMDGAFHNKSFFQSYEEVHRSDVEKDKVANDNGLFVIRIDCDYKDISTRFEYIKSHVLNSDLSNLLDFSNINWDMANEFAIQSSIKLASDLWNSGILGTGIIGEKLGVSKSTAKNYLKIAMSLGMCNYNEDEIKKRMLIRIDQNNKKRRRPVAVITNSNIVGVFSSATELDNISMQLFNKHFDVRNVLAVCNSKRKQAYGYEFKFISHEEYNYYYEVFSNRNTIQNYYEEVC